MSCVKVQRWRKHIHISSYNKWGWSVSIHWSPFSSNHKQVLLYRPIRVNKKSYSLWRLICVNIYIIYYWRVIGVHYRNGCAMQERESKSYEPLQTIGLRCMYIGGGGRQRHARHNYLISVLWEHNNTGHSCADRVTSCLLSKAYGTGLVV